MATYDVGDLVYVSAVFYTTASALIDPTTAYLLYNRVYGGVTAATITATYPGTLTRLSTGVYAYSVTASAAGRYRYKWAGSGSAVGAGAGEFYVQASQV